MSKTDPAEAAAFHYVPLLTGTRLEHWDTDGRQGAVDALLHYPDGRVASLEVTSAAAEGRRQLYRLLNDHAVLPNPGEWTWSITIDDPRDFPELLNRYRALIVKSEAMGITRPDHAYRQAFAGDHDFEWAVRASVTLSGSPELPKLRADGHEYPLYVTQGGSGGAVDEELAGFEQAVVDLLALEHVQKRVAKLERDGRNEQHLFVLADESALPFPVAYALMARPELSPPGVPPLPVRLTHLWLLVTFTPWVLLGTGDGWSKFARE
jgi:hypothetical protein